MVIVQGMFRMDPQERDNFLAQSIEQMERSRKEKGCLEYALAADPVETDRVILSERWDSMEDLAAHAQAVTARREDAAAEGKAPRVTPSSHEITVYEVSSSQPLG